MKANAIKYIPSDDLRRLNRIAARHGKHHLSDDCPVMKDGFKAPVFRALPGIDSAGWVRCVIPATPDCTVQVCLDVKLKDFEKLPVHGGLRCP